MLCGQNFENHHLPDPPTMMKGLMRLMVKKGMDVDQLVESIIEEMKTED